MKCEFCSYKKRYEQMTDNVGSILAGSLWRGWWTLQRCPLILCPTTLLRLFVQSLATTQLFNTCLPESKEHPNGINELCVKMIFLPQRSSRNNCSVIVQKRPIPPPPKGRKKPPPVYRQLLQDLNEAESIQADNEKAGSKTCISFVFYWSGGAKRIKEGKCCDGGLRQEEEGLVRNEDVKINEASAGSDARLIL